MNYNKRQESLLASMPEYSMAILCAAKEKNRSNDTFYPFRQDSNFYYLTGFEEPDAVFLLIKNGSKSQRIIFVHPKDPVKEMWEGKRLGVDDAPKHLELDQAFSIEDLDTTLPGLLKGCAHLFYKYDEMPIDLQAMIGKLKKSKESYLIPSQFYDIDPLLFQQRRTKDDVEIGRVRSALALTAKAHHAAMAIASPLKYEYEVLALIEYIFKSGGASWDAYTTIVAGGNNANTLHYISNKDKLQNGDLALIDAGAEFGLYASDVTRTFPINGKFSLAQKELYSIILDTQKAVISMIKPDVLRSTIGDKAISMLSQGLIDTGIVKATLDEVIEKELYKPFYPHGIGHWMGLDVHDPLAYKDFNGKELAFKAGDILTIEPGLYLNANDTKIPKAYQGIGIRIEDDILVTPTGHENLSAKIAKDIDEVETMCQKSLYDYI